MAFTVTATQGGSTNAGMLLSVKVLSQAAVVQNGNTASVSGASLSPPDLAITPNATGSVIFGAEIISVAASAFTPSAATTYFQNTSQSNIGFATMRSTATTTASTPVTIGGTAPTGGTSGGIALAEILSSGAITVDASTPADTAFVSATTITTASFTPGPGRLLVAMIASLSGSGVETMAITDTSGLSLTWTALIQAHNANNGYAGVFIAQMPASAVAFNSRRALVQPLRFRQRAFEAAPPGTVTLGQYPGEFTGRHPVWPPPARGRVRVVVPPGNQITAPPAEFTGRHPTWPPPRRGRVFQPEPAGIQVRSYYLSVTRRGTFAPALRGRVFAPMELGTVAVIQPPLFAHGRTNLVQVAAAPRRGHQFAPPSPLVVQTPGTSVALGPPSRRFLALAQPARGRSFVPVYPATPFTPATGIQRWLGATHIVDYSFQYSGLGSRHIAGTVGGTDYQYDGSKSD